MGTEQVTLDFTEEGVDALADLASEINGNVENIGARRLHTVMEKLLEEVSFTASDRPGDEVSIDAAYVQSHVGELAKDQDLSRFIL
ncbi:MAG: HslU--HslV peptidase ATPase subunit, partial [Kiloniellales bacterium]